MKDYGRNRDKLTKIYGSRQTDRQTDTDKDRTDKIENIEYGTLM